MITTVTGVLQTKNSVVLSCIIGDDSKKQNSSHTQKPQIQRFQMPNVFVPLQMGVKQVMKHWTITVTVYCVREEPTNITTALNHV